MSSSNKNSPLYKIRRPLEFLRWIGGFPIKPLDPSFSHFRFIPWLECIRFSIVILMFVLEHVYFMLMVIIYEGNLNNYFAFYENNYNKFSASKVDQFTTIFIYLTTLLSAIVFLIVFKSNSTSISEFCKDAKELKSQLTSILIKNEEEWTTIKHCYELENCTKTIVYGQILNIVSSILWGIWANIFLKIHDDSALNYGKDIQIVYPILHAFTTAFIFFGPMACSAELVVGQIVKSITDLFCQWEDILKCCSYEWSENNARKTQSKNSGALAFQLEQNEMLHKSETNLDETNSKINQNETVIDIGLQLEKLIITANRATQGLIATIFTSLIICLTLVCYHVVSTLGLNDAVTGKLRNLQIIAGIFTVAMYLIRFHSLMNTGQMLSIKVKQCRRAFENNVIINQYKGMDDEYKQKSLMLQKRLEMYQYVAPISPYAVFGLNNKTFCATLATIISYIVILIKLRGVETPKTTASIQFVNETISM